MLDRKYIDDHDVIERYLADQLSEPEREGFEAYFMEHPEVVHELNRTARFKSALLDLHDAGRLQPLLAPRSSRTRALLLTLIAIIIAATAVIAASRRMLGD